MPPKKDTSSVETIEFLPSIIANGDKIPTWKEVAQMNGIAGTKAVDASKTA